MLWFGLDSALLPGVHWTSRANAARSPGSTVRTPPNGSATGAVDQASEGIARWQTGAVEEAPAQLRGTDDTTPGRALTVRRRARRTGRRGEEHDGPSDNRTGPGHDEERRGVGRQGLG